MAAVPVCDSLSCSSREDDRARATMVSSSRGSVFFLGFFLAGRPGFDGTFLLVPPVCALNETNANMRTIRLYIDMWVHFWVTDVNTGTAYKD